MDTLEWRINNFILVLLYFHAKIIVTHEVIFLSPNSDKHLISPYNITT